jgi:NTP pyrophosphatase (non-canonical NTP hydrolase)
MIPKSVRKVSKLETKNLVERGLKLTEEVGELSTEILRYKQLKSADGLTAEQVMHNLQYEAVDVMLMAMDILAYTGASDSKIEEMVNYQLARWKKGNDDLPEKIWTAIE